MDGEPKPSCECGVTGGVRANNYKGIIDEIESPNGGGGKKGKREKHKTYIMFHRK